jgi:hypothetical protein
VSSLELTLRQIATDEQDPRALGRQQLAAWSTLLMQGLRARESRPAQAAQFLDLHFHEIASDALGCVRRVYAHFELPFSPAHEQRVREYLAANPREQHGQHRYTLAGFGLMEAEVDAAFADYCARFGVRREGPA